MQTDGDLLTLICALKSLIEINIVSVDNLLVAGRKHGCKNLCKCPPAPEPDKKPSASEELEDQKLLLEVEDALRKATLALSDTGNKKKSIAVKREVGIKKQCNDKVVSNNSSLPNTVASKSSAPVKLPRVEELIINQNGMQRGEVTKRYKPAYLTAPFKTDGPKRIIRPSSGRLSAKPRRPNKSAGIGNKFESLASQNSTGRNFDAGDTDEQDPNHRVISKELTDCCIPTEPLTKHPIEKPSTGYIPVRSPDRNCPCVEEFNCLQKKLDFKFGRLYRLFRDDLFYANDGTCAKTLQRIYFLRLQSKGFRAFIPLIIKRYEDSLFWFTQFVDRVQYVDLDEADTDQLEWIQSMVSRFRRLVSRMETAREMVLSSNSTKKDPNEPAPVKVNDPLGEWISLTRKQRYPAENPLPTSDLRDELLDPFKAYLSIGSHPKSFTFRSRLSTLLNLPDFCSYSGKRDQADRFLRLWSELEIAQVESILLKHYTRLLPELMEDISKRPAAISSKFRQLYALVCGSSPVALKDTFED
ncbi:unnamed protein product [Calicophoron daubneyi]|uniref:Uncharacterized protein n=1 Tax=Calicophoron daubneyi TaxID=300641 RepID=A0AAV2T112_CALDB